MPTRSPFSPEFSKAHQHHVIAAVVAVSALCLHFLVFVRLAFLDGLPLQASQTSLEWALALGGTAGVLAATRWLSPGAATRQTAAGFAACALTSLPVLWIQTQVPALLVGAVVGISLGWTGTALVSCLRPSVRLSRLGGSLGVGVGLAYALCDQPLLYSATGRTQTVIAVLAATTGAVFSLRLRGEPTRESSSHDYRWIMVIGWTAAFLALVWIGFALSLLIRHSPFLKTSSWEGVTALEGNAFIALCACVLTGLALNRQQLAAATGFALAAFLAACLFLERTGYYFPAARVFHTAATSIGAVAFFYYPARSGRPALVAVFLSVAGWLGLVGGHSLARTQNAVPNGFMIAAVLLGVAVLIGRYYWIRYVQAAEEKTPRPQLRDPTAT